MLPACLGQPLPSTPPPSTKTLLEHIMAPRSISILTVSISFPPPPYREPAWFGTSHMQPLAPTTWTATHSSTEPTHSPPARERRGCEMKSWSVHGKGVGGEMTNTMNPAPAPETAAKEKVQKLNSATAIKVTTHHGPTPCHPARASTEPQL